MSDSISHEIRRFEVLDSSNAYCFRNADSLKSGTVVMAEYQSEGKGTLNRKWQSNAHENLLFSIIYKEEDFVARSLFSLRIALAITIALKEYGLSPTIKWPNDILVDDCKIAGILIEIKQHVCVVGIGININQEAFPLSLHATSLYNQIEKKSEPVGVLLKVLDALDEVLLMDEAIVRINYRKVLDQKGQLCIVKMNQTKILATIKDINDEGYLVVEDEQHQLITIYSKAMLER
jgi:BirA family biotin operon repressor/biotin-[acetyl-CoA-carboxylase] ligase